MYEPHSLFTVWHVDFQKLCRSKKAKTLTNIQSHPLYGMRTLAHLVPAKGMSHGKAYAQIQSALEIG